MNAYLWFRSVAEVLGDDEPNRPFQRYTLKGMVDAYNRGMAIVYKYRQDLFVEYKKVKLITGSLQSVIGCCDKVLEVVAQVDENGGTIRDLQNTKNRPEERGNAVWNKKSCLTYVDTEQKEIEYIIDYAEIDKDVQSSFSVYPPVPCDVDAWVRVKCVSSLPSILVGDIGNNGQNGINMPSSNFHNAAIWHYIIYCMLIGDRHATGAINEATSNVNMFLKLLDIEMKHDIELKRGEYE